MEAASIRSQISQIEQIFTATASFRQKYGYLPGDLPVDRVMKLGFAPRSNNMICANEIGNHIINGYWGLCAKASYAQSGEPALFWADLDKSGLTAKPLAKVVAERLGGTANYIGTHVNIHGVMVPTQNFTLKDVLPNAVVGRDAYLMVWSGGVRLRHDNTGHDMKNYITITGIDWIEDGLDAPWSLPTMTPAVAYAIDSKVDDGLPQSGSALAFVIDRRHGTAGTMVMWGGALGSPGASCTHWSCGANANGPITDPTAASQRTCYDNGNITGPMRYSIAANNNFNCVISIRLPD